MLCEVVADPLLSGDDVEAERGVILEELAMVADSPDELALSRLGEAIYPGHALGWEVLGRDETLEAMDRDQIAAMHDRWYGASNVVIAAAGRLDHDELVEMIDGAIPARRFERPATGPPRRSRRNVSSWSDGTPSRCTWCRVGSEPTTRIRTGSRWRCSTMRSATDRRAVSTARSVTSAGLAYSVFTSHTSYSDSGMVALYVGTTPWHLAEVRTLVADQLAAVQSDGITDEELEVAVGYLSGSTVLALEDPGTRMARLGAGELTRRGVVPIADVLDGYAGVTHEDVVRVARRVFGGPSSTVGVGPLRESDLLD